jgi:hypothetical protein
MEYTDNLTKHKKFSILSSYTSLGQNFCFIFAIIINIIVLFSYKIVDNDNNDNNDVFIDSLIRHILLLLSGIHFLVSFLVFFVFFKASRKPSLSNIKLTFYAVCTIFSLLGTIISPLFFSFHLLEIVIRSVLLQNVFQAVMLNGRSLILTALLGVIVIYIYAIIAFVSFHEQFVLLDDGSKLCNTLALCLVTVFNFGITGSLSDVMEQIGYSNNEIWFRLLFDVSFFIIVLIILLNIIFGIVIDSFSQLRDEKALIENDMKEKCFICSISEAEFNRHSIDFQHHIKNEHLVWEYLYFFVYLKRKEVTDFTGAESFCCEMIKKKETSFFPINMSLSIVDKMKK